MEIIKRLFKRKLKRGPGKEQIRLICDSYVDIAVIRATGLKHGLGSETEMGITLPIVFNAVPYAVQYIEEDTKDYPWKRKD